MTTWLDFLNRNSGAIGVLANSVLVFITAIYVYLTWKLVRETRQMKVAQTVPKVIVYVRPRDNAINWFDLVVQNVGASPAYDVSFSVHPDFRFGEGRHISDLGLIKDGIRFLPNEDKIQFFFTSLLEDFDYKVKTPFHIDVKYKDGKGKEHEGRCFINFSLFVGMAQVGNPPLYEIAESVKSIKNNFEQVSSGLKKPRVIVYAEIEKPEKKAD